MGIPTGARRAGMFEWLPGPHISLNRPGRGSAGKRLICLSGGDVRVAARATHVVELSLSRPDQAYQVADFGSGGVQELPSFPANQMWRNDRRVFFAGLADRVCEDLSSQRGASVLIYCKQGIEE